MHKEKQRGHIMHSSDQNPGMDPAAPEHHINTDQTDETMSINLKMPDIEELKPRIIVFGCGGAGGNAVNNMIRCGLDGVDFVVANTDSQALSLSEADRIIQMGVSVTEGLGAGSQPEIGRAAAEEVLDEITDHLSSAHMVFITAGMGGGTGTGAAPVVARAARELGILTVAVVTKPFHFEGARRMRVAEAGIDELQANVDTLICIPNQNLFRIANEKTTFADAFSMADQVLYSGVACITDLMVKEGLINLDFADVRSVMRGMGKAMMGTGEASGDKRAIQAAEAAIANPLLDDISMKGAGGLLISITGGQDMTLFEVDEAATRIREEVDPDANIILGATFDENMEGMVRVSVVATGIEDDMKEEVTPADVRMAELANRKQIMQENEQRVSEQVSSRPVYQQPAARQAAPAQPVAPRRAQEAAPSPRQEQSSAPVRKPAATAPQNSGQPQQAVRKPAQPSVHQVAPSQPVVAKSDPQVRIGPFRPDPALIRQIDLEADVAHEAQKQQQVREESPYIPPAPQQAQSVPAPRIPAIDEFPEVAQRQHQAHYAPDSVQPSEEERGPIGLLKKLASVGLQRREEAAQDAALNRAQSQAQQAAHERQHDREAHLYQPGSSLDAHGRAVSQAGLHDDDNLDIPAFLRRQN
jgi:cell division protein FtsZ